MLRDFIVPESRVVDLGRDRLPLQARPDSRGLLLRALEVGARRAPRSLRRLAQGTGGRGAARGPRLPPRPCRGAAEGARRQGADELAAGGRRRARRSRPTRLAARGQPRRAPALPARDRARAHARAPLPGRARRMEVDRLPVVSREMEEVCAAAEAGDRRHPGPGADRARRRRLVRDADVPRAEGWSKGARRARSRRQVALRRARRSRDDLVGARRPDHEELVTRRRSSSPAGGPQGPGERAARRARERLSGPAGVRPTPSR